MYVLNEDSTADSSNEKFETGLERQEHFSQFQDTIHVLPCHIYLPECLWITEPQNRFAKKNTGHGNEIS